MLLGASVVGVQDQLALAAFADPLPDVDFADLISGHLGDLPIGDVPGGDLAAPVVDHQLEVNPHAPQPGVQVGDDPAPELIGAICAPPEHGRCICWWAWSTR
jgi:hypothetical protein